jgi:hypothetical protein
MVTDSLLRIHELVELNRSTTADWRLRRQRPVTTLQARYSRHESARKPSAARWVWTTYGALLAGEAGDGKLFESAWSPPN